jgi:hypothetical protein
MQNNDVYNIFQNNLIYSCIVQQKLLIIIETENLMFQ